MMKKVIAGVAGVVALASSSAFAANVEIKGAGVAFAPAVVFAQVGDTLSFRNMASHFVESYAGMIPDGAAAMKSEMGADYDYNAAKEGIYVYKCPPHIGARMAGIAIVGKPADAAATIDKMLASAPGELKKVLGQAKEELSKHGM